MLIETALISATRESTPHPVETAAKSGGKSSVEGSQVPKDAKVGGLVLTRHIGQSIMIGDDVEVLITSVRSGVVRLKFLAPRSVAIYRREIFEAIRGDAPADEVLPIVLPSPASSPGPNVGGGLVLARSHGQSVMIGDEVELTVVDVKSSTIKLRVTAPKSVAVHRREVFDAIRADQG